MDYLDYEGLQRYHELLYNDINDIKDTIEENEEITASALNNLNNRFGELGNAVEAVEAIYYTQEEADAYNTEHDLSSGDEGYVTTETIKTPAVEEVPHTVKSYVDDNFISKCINTTYDELKGWRDNSQLVPGQWYRITDYVTTTRQSRTRSAGHQFDVIVLALTENTLSEDAHVTKHEGDAYYNDAKIDFWKIQYCFDNDDGRFKWAASNIKAIYINEEYKERYRTGDVEGADYPYAWGTSTEVWFTSSETPNENDTAYSASDGTGNSYTIDSFSSEGKGVIFYMRDLQGNECPYDFTNIQFKRYELYPQNCIIRSSYFNPLNSLQATLKLQFFNVISYLSGSSSSYAKYMEFGRIYRGSDISYEYCDSNGDSVEIDSSGRYMALVHTSTTVNSQQYVMGLCKIESYRWFYTFDSSRSDFTVKKISSYGGRVYNNVIKPAYREFNQNYFNSTRNRVLNNIIFHLGSLGTSMSVSNNIFEEGCIGCTMSNRQLINNKFIRSMFIFIYNQAMGNILSECTFCFFEGSNTTYNILMNCYSMYFGGKTTHNNFYNTSFFIADREFNNNICLYINTGIFGNYFENNYFHRNGDPSNVCFYDLTENVVYNYCRNCKMTGQGNIIIKCSETTSASQAIQNITINEIGSTTITIDTVGQDYLIEYKPANSQIIEV